MTTFTGNFSGSITYDGYGNQSDNVTAADAGPQVFDAWLEDPVADDGALTDTQPITEPAVTLQGNKGFAGSGNDHWYYRVHIIPGAINVGNVLTDTTQTFTVWNAWFEPVTVGSISATGDTSGLTLSPPVPFEVPYVIPPLEDHTYTLDVSVNGASIIDVTYTFTFSSGEVIDLPVTGQRIFAWTFRPNWGRDIEERMEWATDVITAYDGTEQRIGLRQTPRRTLSYQFMIDNNADRRRFEAMLFNWGARVWMVPFWMEGNTLPAGLESGATSFTIARMSSNWVAGGYAIIISEAFSYSIVKISTIDGNTINLNSATTVSWPAGAVVYPAVTGLLDEKQRLARFTRDTEYGICTFKLFEDENVEADTPTTYRDLPVITQAPHWQSDITHDFLRKMQVVDFRLGKFSFEDEAGMPFNIINHHWVADGKEAIDALRSFIYARHGKQKAVWLPTFTPDIELVVDAGAASVYLDVEHAMILKHLWGHQNRKDIRIELYDGTVLHRRVTDVEEMSGTVERLTIDSPLGLDIDIDDVERISWMSVARFDTDSLSLMWKHDDWAELAVNWRTVRDVV